jgi:uncharacterized protein YecE (DUF72 family)
VYVRFHGTTGLYAGSYDAAALDAWAQRLAREWRDGRDIYAYFNNDVDAHAVENARELRGRLESAIGVAAPGEGAPGAAALAGPSDRSHR